MCRFCNHVDEKLAEIIKRRSTMICTDTGKKRQVRGYLVYTAQRAEYDRDYYRKNRDKKLKAANERNRMKSKEVRGG